MAQIRLLYRLQEIDSEIRAKKQRLGEVIRLQKEDQALQKARQARDAAAQQRDKWQKERKRLEIEIADLEGKSKNASNRLYSGNVKNPKELTDLQHQIEAMGRHRSSLEDQLLETMLELEEAETRLAAAQEQCQQVEAAWERNHAGLLQEQEQLALVLHDLMSRRPGMATLIKPDTLSHYEQLSQKLGGVAVAMAQYNLCSVCRVTISAQKIKMAQEGSLVYCGSCGRILYAP